MVVFFYDSVIEHPYRTKLCPITNERNGKLAFKNERMNF